MSILHSLFGKSFSFEREHRLSYNEMDAELQRALQSVETDETSQRNKQEIRTVILTALSDNGEFDAGSEMEKLWNSFQKFTMELPSFQGKTVGDMNQILAKARRKMPKNTDELADFAVHLGLITPGELAKVSREGAQKSPGGSTSQGRPSKDCPPGVRTPSSGGPEPIQPVPEKPILSKRERKAMLDGEIRSSRKSIDDYNSKRVGILKDYESQKYKSPAERRKAYKEACAKIQELRKEMGDPVGKYWEVRNEWEGLSKQSWSRKLAGEQGRDMLPSPRKKEQAKVIRVFDEKTGKLLAAYDEWTGNYSGSIRQADALSLIRGREEDLAIMRKRSGGKYLDLRSDASSVARLGDDEAREKAQESARNQESGRVLARRDSIGAKLDGLQGYKGRLTKKYLAEATAGIPDASSLLLKKNAGSVGQNLARIDREKAVANVRGLQEDWSENLPPYTGKSGLVIEVKKDLAEIDLRSADFLQEGQILHYLKSDGTRYGGRAKVLRVTDTSALVRYDKAFGKPPAVGDIIGPNPQYYEKKKKSPQPPTEAPRSSEKPVEAPKPAPPSVPRSVPSLDPKSVAAKPSGTSSLGEGAEFTMPVMETKPTPDIAKPSAPIVKNIPSEKEAVVIPDAPPDPDFRDVPKRNETGLAAYAKVDDADDIVKEIERGVARKKEAPQRIPQREPSSLESLRRDVVSRKLPVDPRRLDKLTSALSAEDVREIMGELRAQKIDPRLLDRVEEEAMGKIATRKKEAEALVRKNLEGDLSAGLEAATLRRRGVEMPETVQINPKEPAIRKQKEKSDALADDPEKKSSPAKAQERAPNRIADFSAEFEKKFPKSQYKYTLEIEENYATKNMPYLRVTAPNGRYIKFLLIGDPNPQRFKMDFGTLSSDSFGSKMPSIMVFDESVLNRSVPTGKWNSDAEWVAYRLGILDTSATTGEKVSAATPEQPLKKVALPAKPKELKPEETEKPKPAAPDSKEDLSKKYWPEIRSQEQYFSLLKDFEALPLEQMAERITIMSPMPEKAKNALNNKILSDDGFLKEFEQWMKAAKNVAETLKPNDLRSLETAKKAMQYTPVNPFVVSLLEIRLASSDGFNSAEAEFHVRTQCLNKFKAKIYEKAEDLAGRWS